MCLKKRGKYFVGSLRYSAVELCVSIILLGVACVFLVMFPCLSNNQITSLLIGVVSGVIATLVLSIAGKYAESNRAYETIHALLNNVILKAKDCAKHKDCYPNEILSFGYDYTDICRQSIDLTYKVDFEEVSGVMKKLLSCNDWQNFEEVIEELERARDAMFE